MTNSHSPCSADIGQADLERLYRITWTLHGGIPFTRFCDLRRELISAPAQSSQVRLETIEECARVIENMPIQIYGERTCKPATFDDAASAIRALAAQPPAARVETEFDPSEWETILERREDALHSPSSAGNGYDPAEFRKLQDIIDNQADQILDLHEILKSAYTLHEFIAGAYVLSLADFRYLNVVSTKIKEALPGGDVTPIEPQSVEVTAADVIAQMKLDNEREPFPECAAAIRLVELATKHIKHKRSYPLPRPHLARGE